MALPSIPKCINGFDVLEKLGNGSYATVYKGLGRDVSSGIRKSVAIKCVSRKLSKANLERVINEISVLKTLSHRHIVQFVDLSWDAHHIYIIMEYCSGGDLASLIRQNKVLSEPVARRFFQQLASAIQYMWERNVVHLDLKPQNLLITNRADPSIKVADFGLCLTLLEDECANLLCGSLLYMAPEVFNRKTYGAKADLWSAGIILYECVFGRAPFSGGEVDDIKRNLRALDPIQIPTYPIVSDTCSDILKRLLIRDPHQRIGFEEFFVHKFVGLSPVSPEKALAEADKLIAKADLMEREGNTTEALEALSTAKTSFLSYFRTCEGAHQREYARGKLEIIARKEKIFRSRTQSSRSASQEPQSLSQEFSYDCEDSPPSSLTQNAVEEWADTPQIAAAFLVIRSAQKLERDGHTEEALRKYTLAIESCLKVLESEPANDRKKLLRQRVVSWLSAAENLKKQSRSVAEDACFVTSVNPLQAAPLIQEEVKSCSIQ
ncbi:hypothetical protein L596_027427 [Steinernema carpocapsae]|uniref:Serine/threonine-protein kinase ULK3 n=1 Tax=Steinernema carpocapsae TaxID=34508 RepID=A0A4U5M494_STECR|nr:hypothetical protein L596_027427 [Steinernema carpocapsae]